MKEIKKQAFDPAGLIRNLQNLENLQNKQIINIKCTMNQIYQIQKQNNASLCPKCFNLNNQQPQKFSIHKKKQSQYYDQQSNNPQLQQQDNFGSIIVVNNSSEDDKVNQLRPQIDKLQLKVQQLQEEMQVKEKYQAILQLQNDGLQKQFQETQDHLIACKLQVAELQEIQDNQANSIKQINLSKSKLVDELQNVTNDRNNLQERMVKEKQEFAQKLNEINDMHQEYQLKLSQLKDDIQIQQLKKSQFQDIIAQKGLKDQMPKLAPGMDDPEGKKQKKMDLPLRSVKKFSKFHQNEIYQITQSLNGSQIATCGGDYQIKIFNPINQVVENTITSHNTEQIFVCLAFSQYAELIAAGTTDKSVLLWNYTTTKLKHQFMGHLDKVNSVQFTSEKDKFLSASDDRTLRLWEMEKGKCLKTISSGSAAKSIYNLISEPHVITGHSDGSIRMYSIRENSNQAVYHMKNIFEGDVCCVKASANNNYILASSKDGYFIKLIDLRKREVVKIFKDDSYMNSHDNNSISFGPNDESVIAGNFDSSIFFWDIYQGKKKEILTKTGHEGVITGCEFHNVTGYLYTSDTRGGLCIWD